MVDPPRAFSSPPLHALAAPAALHSGSPADRRAPPPAVPFWDPLEEGRIIESEAQSVVAASAVGLRASPWVCPGATSLH